MLGKFASSVMVLYIFYILCRFRVFKAKLVEGRDGKTTWELKSLSLKSQLEQVNPSEENDCESGAQLRANVETDRGVWRCKKWRRDVNEKRDWFHREWGVLVQTWYTGSISLWSSLSEPPIIPSGINPYPFNLPYKSWRLLRVKSNDEPQTEL